MKRNRWVIFLTSALLGVGALSGCEKGEADAASKISVPQTDAGEHGDLVGDGDPDSEAADFDGADQGGGDTLDPDDGGEGNGDEGTGSASEPAGNSGSGGDDDSAPDPAAADPDSADTNQLSVLPTDGCPIDIPAPFTPHSVDREEPGDGAEVHCVVHVSSKGDPVYLEQDIIEQFNGLDAQKVESVTAADPYDTNDITIHSWNYSGDEVIVNMRYAGPTGVELIYVVRDIR